MMIEVPGLLGPDFGIGVGETMRVDDSNLRGANPAGAENAGRAERAAGVDRAGRTHKPAEPGDGAGGEDFVSLSSLAEKLQEMGIATPEREARLQELTRAVESGNYKVDSAELSRSLIQGAFDSAK
jgi:anti-sigma28 factor (negative regulator of flagellin synthesis)